MRATGANSELYFNTIKNNEESEMQNNSEQERIQGECAGCVHPPFFSHPPFVEGGIKAADALLERFKRLLTCLRK